MPRPYLVSLDEVRAAMDRKLLAVSQEAAVEALDIMIKAANEQLRDPSSYKFPLKVVIYVGYYSDEVIRLLLPILQHEFEDKGMLASMVYTGQYVNISVTELSVIRRQGGTG